MKSIKVPLQWFQAFLAGEAGTLRRVYSVESYLGFGRKVTIITDASPWGIGGVLVIDGWPSEYFHDAITPLDANILNVIIGESSAQQAAEALGVLVALRPWAPLWKGKRVNLSVKMDSVSALTILLKCKSAGDAPSVVAREVALDMAGSIYIPNVMQHVPGVANVMADALSRWHDPGRERELPALLRGASLRIVAPRLQPWWRALSPP